MFKKLLMTGLIGLLLPMGVNAASFKDGDTTYTLEKREISCIEGKDFLGVDKSGNIIMGVDTNASTTHYKIGADNKCIEMTEQEFHDFGREPLTTYYIAEKNGEEVLYKERYDFIGSFEEGYFPAGTYDSSKTYYQFNGSGYEKVDASNESDIANYFERVYFVYPESLTLDPNETYYTIDLSMGYLNYTKVNNPVQDDMFMYYVIDADVSKYDDIKIMTLDKSTFGSITGSKMVFNSYDGKQMYIVVGENNNYSVYTIEGKKIFENIKWFHTYSNGLFGVINQNDEFQFYNSDIKLLHTEPSTDQRGYFETYYKDNYTLLYTRDDVFFNLTQTKSETTTEIKVPATGDNIITMFVIGGLSLAGIVGVIVYSKKKKIFD